MSDSPNALALYRGIDVSAVAPTPPPQHLKASDKRWLESNKTGASFKVLQLTGDTRLMPPKAQTVFGFRSKQAVNERNIPDVVSPKAFKITGDPLLVPEKARRFFGVHVEAGSSTGGNANVKQRAFLGLYFPSWLS